MFVESFDSLRSFIFNNVKARFRQTADYTRDEDFRTKGFGRGQTLFRFKIDELLRLLFKRAGSAAESEAKQKEVFWNRICSKIILMLLLIKTRVRSTHSDCPDVSINKFCQLLQFRFQIDRQGRPWLFDIKSDKVKF